MFIVIVWIAFAAFFRDPERHIPEDPEVLVSPADGVVRDCELIPHGSCGCPELAELFEGSDMFRIGIFLSVLDVHVNRAPCRMTVRFVRHKDGRTRRPSRKRFLLRHEQIRFPDGALSAGQKRF